MDVRVFNFPTRDDDYTAIEKRLYELEDRVRYGADLDEVEMDWVDTANTWLIAVENNSDY